MRTPRNERRRAAKKAAAKNTAEQAARIAVDPKASGGPWSIDVIDSRALLMAYIY